MTTRMSKTLTLLVRHCVDDTRQHATWMMVVVREKNAADNNDGVPSRRPECSDTCSRINYIFIAANWRHDYVINIIFVEWG